ncbi:MAG: hypothetical protein ACXWC4_14350 [Telluria sp.]
MRLPHLVLATAIGIATSVASAQANGSFANDLDVARRDYVMKSLAFSPADRAAALRYIDSIKPNANRMSKPEQMAALMRITAFAHNGHDWLKWGTGWSPTMRLPVRLLWLADGMVVARTSPEYQRLLGARVTAIEGRSLDQLVAALRTFHGGPDNSIRWTSAWQIDAPQLMQAMGLASHPDRLNLTLQLADGTTESLDMPAVPTNTLPRIEDGVGFWSHQPSTNEPDLGWRNAVKAQEDPLYLQEPTRLYRMRELPGLDALYIQFRGNYNGHGESVEEFAATVQKQLATTSAHNIVLDERFNSGGNTDLTMDLMRTIGQRTSGKVYVLTSNRTFSAGIASTALVKHESRGRAVIVGEQVGDRLRWWSEGDATWLPNSGYGLAYTTGLWDLVHGCARIKACWSDRFNANVASLTPEIVAPMTVADWMQGKDAALEAVARDLAGHQ